MKLAARPNPEGLPSGPIRLLLATQPAFLGAHCFGLLLVGGFILAR